MFELPPPSKTFQPTNPFTLSPFATSFRLKNLGCSNLTPDRPPQNSNFRSPTLHSSFVGSNAVILLFRGSLSSSVRKVKEVKCLYIFSERSPMEEGFLLGNLVIHYWFLGRSYYHFFTVLVISPCGISVDVWWFREFYRLENQWGAEHIISPYSTTEWPLPSSHLLSPSCILKPTPFGDFNPFEHISQSSMISP